MDATLIVLAFICGIVISACYLSYRDRKFEPPVVEDNDAEIIDGIAIGKYYGDPENKVCVEVVAVENSVVAFRHLGEEMSSMPKEAFLEKYYKYPNGCEFPDIDKY